VNLSEQFNISVSYNKQVILTSQEMDNTYGQRDIYITLVNPDGSQTTVNAGSMINTRLDESSPFLSPDYKTLYFASKGHNGFGGYDIYVSRRLDETWQSWTEPENLGPGINTINNEEFFNYTYDGQYAYFQSEITAENTDLYRVPLASLYMKNGFVGVESTMESMGLGDLRRDRKGMTDINIGGIDGSRLAQMEQ
jgi:hypothetical protein